MRFLDFHSFRGFLKMYLGLGLVCSAWWRSILCFRPLKIPGNVSQYADDSFNLCRQLAHRLTLLSPTDPFRLRYEKLLLEKCYDMGLLGEGKKLSEVENKIGVSRLCRRRLGVVMTRLSMCPNVQTVSFDFEFLKGFIGLSCLLPSIDFGK